MKFSRQHFRILALSAALGCGRALAQIPGGPPPDGGFSGDGPPGFGGPPPFGRGGFGPGGPGVPGMMQQQIKLVKQFDQNGDGWLNRDERKAARELINQQRAGRRMGPGSFGGPRGGFGPGEAESTAQPGPKVSAADVKSAGNAPVYDARTLRTLFLEFENEDWEKELADFHNTDVDVPAKLTVDGKVYRDVGVHFRGASSYMMVGEGRKRSLNLSLDFIHQNQQLGGYRTFDLLNSHEDPTFLRTVLYYHIAREYLPAPKANFVRVVINGESWGVYVNSQQFNKDFINDWFHTTKGARWKVPGSPGGRGGLNYLGEDPAPYKRIYEIKTKDSAKSWADLIRLCKVLNQTPPGQLEQELKPLLDVDGALKFLALENALINNDGYWIRASDYNIYQDERGQFHIFPHDANETFSPAGGPGFGGPGMRGGRGFGPGMEDPPGRDANAGGLQPGGAPGFRGGRGGGIELDPLVGANDSSKALLSKLLAVPALRERYLRYVREIVEKWLDWNTLGPIAREYQAVITEDVKADTRKLYSTDAFLKGLTDDSQPQQGFGPPGGGARVSLKSFADQRRAYLLKYTDAEKSGSQAR